MPRRLWWTQPLGLLLLAGVVSSGAAWILIAAPVAMLQNVARHSGHFQWVYLHMLGGTVMLVLGAANLYVGATRHGFRWHKALGFAYLFGGGFGALIALYLALASPHHKNDGQLEITLSGISNTGASTATLAVAWLMSVLLAYRAARNRRFESHRDWMIRGFVLAWSFVFCRLAGRVETIANIGEGEAMIWLSWILPLLICEMALQWRAGAPSAARGN